MHREWTRGLKLWKQVSQQTSPSSAGPPADGQGQGGLKKWWKRQPGAGTCLWYRPGLERMRPTHNSASEPGTFLPPVPVPLPGVVARSLRGRGREWGLWHRERPLLSLSHVPDSHVYHPPGGRSQQQGKSSSFWLDTFNYLKDAILYTVRGSQRFLLSKPRKVSRQDSKRPELLGASVTQAASKTLDTIWDNMFL